jgi:dTDP-4-amino-4,6-dideoxygalactose transaminase
VLSTVSAIPPERAVDREHVFHKYVFRVPNRDAVQEALRERGVATLIHYSTTLSALPFAAAAPKRGGGERAARFAREVLSLPVHPHLRDDEVELVCAALADTIA